MVGGFSGQPKKKHWINHSLHFHVLAAAGYSLRHSFLSVPYHTPELYLGILTLTQVVRLHFLPLDRAICKALDNPDVYLDCAGGVVQPLVHYILDEDTEE